MLFEENKKRFCTEKHNKNKTNFDFIDQSCLEEHSVIRKLLNICFSQITPTSKNEIRARIKSSKESEFHAVCFELLIGNLFKTAGCSLEEHPIVPNSNKHPDFLVTLTSGERFYLELVTIGEYDDSSVTRFKSFVKKLRNNENFVNIKEFSGRTISHNDNIKLQESIKKWWQKNKKIPSNTMTFESENKAFCVTLEILSHQEIGIEATVANINFHTQLLEKLKKKANRYGELNLPYVIATTFRPSLFSAGLQFMGELIESTLYGGGRAYNPTSKKFEMCDSLWNVDKEKKTYGNVSGVLFFDELTIYRALEPFKYCFFLNHFAKNPIYEVLTHYFNIYYTDGSTNYRRPGNRIADIFKLSLEK